MQPIQNCICAGTCFNGSDIFIADYFRSLLIPKHAYTIPGKPLGTNEKLVEFEVGDLLKVLAVAGKQGELMLKTRGGNQDVQITDLLSDRPWKAAPNMGKAFHDWLGKWKNGFAFQKAA
jgi:hypothetical protein